MNAKLSASDLANIAALRNAAGMGSWSRFAAVARNLRLLRDDACKRGDAIIPWAPETSWSPFG